MKGDAYRKSEQKLSLPLTIYRLVTRGTIEEKILELHREKRELAEALLAEGDAVARMTPEELMNLILQK